MVYRYAPLPLEDQNVVAVQCFPARWSLMNPSELPGAILAATADVT